MRSDPESIVEGFHTAWWLRDVEATMAYCHPDIRVTMHYHDYALPFAGSTVGWDEAKRRLTMVFRDWTFLDHRSIHTVVEPDTVRTIAPCVLRHNRSGATLDLTFRHVWKIQDGRIISFDGWIDIHLLKSFLRLIESRDRSRTP